MAFPAADVCDDGPGHICTMAELYKLDLLTRSQHHLIQNRSPGDGRVLQLHCGQLKTMAGDE